MSHRMKKSDHYSGFFFRGRNGSGIRILIRTMKNDAKNSNFVKEEGINAIINLEIYPIR